MSIRGLQGRGREHTARGTGQLSFHQPACSDLLDAVDTLEGLSCFLTTTKQAAVSTDCMINPGFLF